MNRAHAIYTFVINAFVVKRFRRQTLSSSNAIVVKRFRGQTLCMPCSQRFSKLENAIAQSDKNGSNTHSSAARRNPTTETTVDITVQV